MNKMVHIKISAPGKDNIKSKLLKNIKIQTHELNRHKISKS